MPSNIRVVSSNNIGLSPNMRTIYTSPNHHSLNQYHSSTLRPSYSNSRVVGSQVSLAPVSRNVIISPYKLSSNSDRLFQTAVPVPKPVTTNGLAHIGSQMIPNRASTVSIVNQPNNFTKVTTVKGVNGYEKIITEKYSSETKYLNWFLSSGKMN